MSHSAPIEGHHAQEPHDRCRRALAEAIAGLEIIRDERPAADPIYPRHGSIEAHDTWGFDSASHERAETARATLASVAEIMEGQPSLSS